MSAPTTFLGLRLSRRPLAVVPQTLGARAGTAILAAGSNKLLSVTISSVF